MNRIEKYLNDTLGVDVTIKQLSEGTLDKLPLYMRSIYNFKSMRLFRRDIILLVQKENEYLAADQYRKHIQNIEQIFNRPVVLILEPIEAYNRKRLIEKQIAFIIPGKQIFVPQLMIDLREFRYAAQKKKEKIQPAAQCLLISHLLRKHVEMMNFKMIAEKLNYTPMTITRAVNELDEKALCRIEGKKEKKIVFERERKDIWETALPYLQNPVKRKIYIEEYLDDNLIFESGYKALSTYTNMADEPKGCYAISNSDYLYLKKQKNLSTISKTEGPICLEIWKYAPGILTDKRMVDPLSLYLAFKGTKDERIELEIEKMVASLW